jgi:hypothetical protein
MEQTAALTAYAEYQHTIAQQQLEQLTGMTPKHTLQ